MTTLPENSDNPQMGDSRPPPCSLNFFGRPIWHQNPECPACGLAMEIPTDKRDLQYGDWECVHPGPHQTKRMFFDYELTMILRSRVRDLYGEIVGAIELRQYVERKISEARTEQDVALCFKNPKKWQRAVGKELALQDIHRQLTGKDTERSDLSNAGHLAAADDGPNQT